jgi:hypothetical protein
MPEMGSKRTIQVKTYLNAEEFVSFHATVERLGLEDSSALRMWIKEAIERHSARPPVLAIVPDQAKTGTEI